MDAFQMGARVLFRDPHLFPETIVYKPSGGVPKTIKARINRSPVRVEGVARGPLAETIVELGICHDADLGITSVKKGLDTVELKLQPGDSVNTEMLISRIVKQTAMDWTLEATR